MRIASVLCILLTSLPAMAGSSEWIVGYVGEGASHPGMRVGAGGALLGEDRATLRWQVGLMLWAHPRNHIGVAIIPQVGPRWTASWGGTAEATVGVGWMHMRPWGRVYSRAGDGQVRKRGHLGYSSLGTMLQVGLGWDFSPQFEVPLTVQVRPFILAQIPSNTFVLPRWGVEGVAIVPMDPSP